MVEYRESPTAEIESVTLLGAWDSEPARGILSYLSGIGKALIGKAVGEVATLPTSDGTPRGVTITSIRRFAQ